MEESNTGPRNDRFTHPFAALLRAVRRPKFASNRAKTIATRLPKAEMEAVEAAASAAGKTCSVWLREAAVAHLKRPVPKKKSSPDPTLLAELLGLRSIVVNLLSAVAVDLPKETVQRIVAHADSIKRGKAEEILRRLEDDAALKTEGK